MVWPGNMDIDSCNSTLNANNAQCTDSYQPEIDADNSSLAYCLQNCYQCCPGSGPGGDLLARAGGRPTPFGPLPFAQAMSPACPTQIKKEVK